MRTLKVFLPVAVIACLFSTLSYAVTPDRITSPIDSSQAVQLARSHHPNAQPKYDQGPVEPSFKLSFITLVTSPSTAQQLALNRLLAQQQDPSSPNYHKWLTPPQYADHFGLSPNDIKRITAWLESQGFAVRSVGGGRNTVVFSGTAGQVQSAFKAEIHRYNVNGEEHFANSTPIMVPTALSSIVTAIRGVNDFRPRPMNIRPSYTLSVTGGYEFFLAPGDVATLYDLSPLYDASTPIDGTGEKLAIIGETDIYLSDINDFRSGFGLTPISTSNCTLNSSGIITACNDPHFKYVLYPGQTDPGSPNSIQDDLEEADLDVEWSGATARNAQIVFINAPDASGNGVNDSLSYALDPPTGTAIPATVVSMSYGLCEVLATSMETELQQGAAEGITVMNSAGDSGAAACDGNPPGTTATTTPPLPYKGAVGGLAVNYPASSVYVTAVGGTSIPLQDLEADASTYWGLSNGSYGASVLPALIGQEIAWNDDAEIAQLCQGDSSNTFCSQGGNPAVSGWVALTSSATAQQVQEDIWTSIGGGGASNCITETAADVCEAGFPQPAWQKSLSVSSAPAGVRWLPDVSLLASPNFPGYILCTELSELGDAGTGSSCASGIASALNLPNTSAIGGTSVSAPVFAGIVTLLNQYLGSNGLGNINAKLYQLAASPSSDAFHQIASGNNNVYCQAKTPANQPASIQCPAAGVLGFSASNKDATTGYNLVTGLGSVDADKLAIAWAASLTNFSMTAGAASPASVSAGGSSSATITIAPVNGFTGTVSLSCSSSPTGVTCPSASVSGGRGTTTLTLETAPNMQTGTTTVTVTGTSGPVSNTATVTIAVTKTSQSFTLSPSASTYQVSQGSNVTANVGLKAANGFDTPVTYTCTDPASESTCTGPAGPINSTTQASFVITTTAATAKMLRPSGHNQRIFYAALLPGLLGIVFTFGSRKRRLQGARLLGLVLLLGFSTLWLGSCSGGTNSSQSNPGTPTGSYTITVSATTGGANPITASTTFTLQVQ